MKKNKLCICLFFISVVLLSCGENEVPPQQANTCKLSSYTGESLANITYQNDKVSKVSFLGDGYVTCEYNAVGKLIKMSYYTDTNVLESYSTFDHVSSALITFKDYEKNFNGIFEEVLSNGRFEFDAVGNLTKKQYDDDNYTRYTYNTQNNPTTSYQKDANSPEYKDREFLNYDDKKNIARENFVFMVLEIGLPIYGVNNPKKILSFDTDGIIDDEVNVGYLYNEQGYVTKAFDNASPSDAIMFQYNCQ